MIYIFNYASPFGNIRLTSDGEFLTNARTEFWQGRADNKGLCPKGESETDGSSLPCLQQAAKWLDIYFGGNIPDFLPPLNYTVRISNGRSGAFCRIFHTEL